MILFAHSVVSKSKRGLLLVGLAILFALTALIGMTTSSALANRGAAIQTFGATLSGAQEVPAVDTIATGSAILALNDTQDTLYYHISVSDIVSITAAHIHDGVAGTNGGVVFGLFDGTGDFGPGQPLIGSTPISPTQVTKLLAGEYYINVHTSQHGPGEVRGQIEPYTPGADYNALLLGSNEVADPPVVTDARGVAKFQLSDTGALAYQINVADISGISAAHIHIGAPDQNGGVAHTLFESPGLFSPAYPLNGSLDLNAEQLVNFLAGHYYVNIHTTDHPAGEIRGQIGGPATFWASLSGANEVPAVDTIASGKAILALSADTSTLYYRVMVDDIDGITAAHIHNAPAGQNGSVEFGLFDGTGHFSPTVPISGSLSLNTAQVLDLIGDNYYINVHTSEHGSGEIRGQIYAYHARQQFNALLLGKNEVPPVASDGAGVARFTLNPVTSGLNFSVAVSDVISITAAHIHLAPMGVNGPVAFGFYDGTGNFDPAHPVSRYWKMGAKALVDLLTGYYYVNIHTTAHGSGELRGQIVGPTLYWATLAGANEVPQVDTMAWGKAILSLDATASRLYQRTMVHDIENITAAHIHGAPAGQNGPVVFSLYDGTGDFDPDNPIDGVNTLTTAQVMNLIRDRYYINVHTQAHGPGEIRGQIVSYHAPTHFNAPLLGKFEVPEVNSNGAGIARFTLDTKMSTLNFTVAVTDVTDISAAHIHVAPSGANGPVAFGFYSGDGNFDATHPINSCWQMGAKALVDLLTGYHYVNIHTAAHGSGELRGQIEGARVYAAQLNGANEVPAVTTDATGGSILGLSADTSKLYYRIWVQNIENITAAHIHHAESGSNGPVAFGLFDGTGDFDPNNPLDGLVELNTSNVLALIRAQYYINVHTQAHGSGEIRGQIMHHTAETQFRANLSGDQEVPAVATTATGVANFGLNAGLNLLYYGINVSDIDNITSAHIHLAPAGQNGPVAFLLYGGEGTFDPETSIAGCLHLGAEALVDLLTDYYYVNIHTVDHNPGEIRGQIDSAMSTMPGEPEDVVINEVFYTGSGPGSATADWIELVNIGSGPVDMSEWQFCAKFTYERLAAMTILNGGDLILDPGEIIVFESWIDLDNSASDLGLYTQGGGFGNPDLMVDFVLWGTANNPGRANVAVSKGIWTETSTDQYDFVPTAASGQSLARTAANAGISSTDFANGASSQGQVNPPPSEASENLYLPLIRKPVSVR